MSGHENRILNKRVANDMTDSISVYLADDHRRCDSLLAACERDIAKKSWPDALESTTAFHDALLRHFAMEEEVLFPELEQANPAAGGPVSVMCMEHRQMRQLLDELVHAVRAHDPDTCLGDLETLHMLSQQHNAKEEGVLYPLADNALGPRADLLAKRLQAA